MTNTDKALIKSVIALYEKVESATLETAYKIGMKVQKVTDKKAMKEELATAKNVKYSTIADYHRFYISLEKTQIALQNEENEQARKEGREAKQFNIVRLACDSKLLYTKMQILSKLAPTVLFEILSNPEHLAKMQGLNVIETENFRHLVNSDKLTIEKAFEKATKDSYGKFQEELKATLTANAIDNSEEEEPQEEQNIPEVIKQAIAVLKANLAYLTTGEIDEILNMLGNEQEQREGIVPSEATEMQ